MQYWLVFIFPSTQIRNRPKRLVTNDATLEELILCQAKGQASVWIHVPTIVTQRQFPDIVA